MPPAAPLTSVTALPLVIVYTQKQGKSAAKITAPYTATATVTAPQTSKASVS